MKLALALFAATAMLTACNLNPAPVSPDLPASANTTAKTGITAWKLTGSSTGATMRGSAGGTVRRLIQLTTNTDGSISAEDRALDANGSEVFKASFTLKDGTITASSPNASPPAGLCMGCVSDDLASAFPNLGNTLQNPAGVSSGALLRPLYTFVINLTCQQARATLDAILAQQAKVCARNPDGQNCQNLEGAAIYAAQFVIAECGIALF